MPLPDLSYNPKLKLFSSSMVPFAELIEDKEPEQPKESMLTKNIWCSHNGIIVPISISKPSPKPAIFHNGKVYFFEL